MANRLIPKFIRDKNGKHTTVHVREDKGGIAERVRNITAPRPKSPVQPEIQGLYGSYQFTNRQLEDHFPEASEAQIFRAFARPARDGKPVLQFFSHRLTTNSGVGQSGYISHLVADYLQDTHGVEVVWGGSFGGRISDGYVRAVVEVEQDTQFTEEDLIRQYKELSPKLEMFNNMPGTVKMLGKRLGTALEKTNKMTNAQLLEASTGEDSDIIRAIPYVAPGRDADGQLWLNIANNQFSTPGAIRGAIENSSFVKLGTEAKVIEAMEVIKNGWKLTDSERQSVQWRIDGMKRVIEARKKLAS